MHNKNIFLLPKVETITFNFSKSARNRYLKKLGYDERLNKTKDKISLLNYEKWTALRKCFNDYEFPLDRSKIKKPISRAFFKLIEIIKDNDINVDCNTLHLAEAPGGFIESTIYKQRKKHKLYTFSIIDEKNEDTPVYHNKIIKDKSVVILSNEKNKGDLYKVSNIKLLSSSLSDKNIKFITCDGGFTENYDFSSKEDLHHKLIFHEILTSLLILKKDGSLVVKIFDIFTELTFDYIYLLCFLFDNVYITKPLTSRPTNSEKYLVCKGYNPLKFNDDMKNILKYLCINNINNYCSFVSKNNLDDSFTKSIKNINTILMNQQINCIEKILTSKVSNKNEKTKEWIDNYY